MTNIQTNGKKNDMHSHIDKAYEIINEHLPTNYTEKVLEKSTDKSLTSGIIRNLRNRVTLYPVSKIDVINILLEVAIEHKKEKERLQELLNQ